MVDLYECEFVVGWGWRVSAVVFVIVLAAAATGGTTFLRAIFCLDVGIDEEDNAFKWACTEPREVAFAEDL